MWSGSPLAVIRDATQRGLEEEREEEDSEHFVFVLLQTPGDFLWVRWRSVQSPRPWMKLAWPTLLPKGVRTPSTPPPLPLLLHRADVHLANLSAHLSLQDMNSVTALSPNTSAHTWLRPLSSFLPYNCCRRPSLPRLTCTVVCFSSGSHVWIWQECWQPSGEPPGCGFFCSLKGVVQHFEKCADWFSC